MLQFVTYMLSEDSHILHHQRGLLKDMSIDPLQYKMRFGRIHYRDEERIIDIATSKGANISNQSRCSKLLGDNIQAIQYF